MYSRTNVPVDKGLGFDFSQIADLAKSVATVGLNVYQNQMTVKQIQATGGRSVAGGYSLPFGPYGQQTGQLPLSQTFGVQPTFGQQPMAYQQPGMSATTMIMLGVVAVGGLLVLKSVLK